MNNIMIDLETMDTRPTAAIVAIGAVAFDPATGRVDSENGFYRNIKLQSAIDAGLSVSGGTICWWLDKSIEVRKEVISASLSLSQALYDLSNWIHSYNIKASDRDGDWYEPCLDVWGNGSDFDNVILSNAYHTSNLEQPWGTYRNRCYRTLKKLLPNIEINRTGTHHNALDDAISQAEHAVRLIQHLNGLKRLGYLEGETKQS